MRSTRTERWLNLAAAVGLLGLAVVVWGPMAPSFVDDRPSLVVSETDRPPELELILPIACPALAAAVEDALVERHAVIRGAEKVWEVESCLREDHGVSVPVDVAVDGRWLEVRRGHVGPL